MKKIYFSILFLFMASCKSNQAENFKWTEDDKDLAYQECIAYVMNDREMNLDESDTYCQCTINVLKSNFENYEDASIKIGNDNSLRLIFEVCNN